MDVTPTIEALHKWRESVTRSVGFVPTMGALHEGHLSLVRRARRECDHVAVSIFVNPSQFGPSEDLAQYPRDLPADLRLLHAEQVDLVFTPDAGRIYPDGFSTWVTEEALTSRWEGASRPGHFRGVATVVLKLFHLVRPERAYFGEKDYQQLRVVERMVRDLDVPVTIVPCPTVREPDGLAMSSRNARLTPREREAATVLWRALSTARAACEGGQDDPGMIRLLVERTISAEPRAQVDYVAVADPTSLEPLGTIDARGAVCCIAARVGSVRLIDNMLLRPPG